MRKTLMSGILSVALLSSYSLVDKVAADTLDESDNFGEVGSKALASETTDISKADHGEMVTIQNGHMPGMKGSTAQIVGVFEPTAYEVTYQPTDGGKVVENRRWDIQEEVTEVKDQEEPLEIGSEVTFHTWSRTVLYPSLLKISIIQPVHRRADE